MQKRLFLSLLFPPLSLSVPPFRPPQEEPQPLGGRGLVLFGIHSPDDTDTVTLHHPSMKRRSSAPRPHFSFPPLDDPGTADPSALLKSPQATGSNSSPCTHFNIQLSTFYFSALPPSPLDLATTVKYLIWLRQIIFARAACFCFQLPRYPSEKKEAPPSPPSPSTSQGAFAAFPPSPFPPPPTPRFPFQLSVFNFQLSGPSPSFWLKFFRNHRLPHPRHDCCLSYTNNYMLMFLSVG